MKKLALLSIFIGVFYWAHAQSAVSLIIKNVNIIPVSADTILSNVSIGFSGKSISHIGSFKSIPKTNNTKVIEGQGKYLMPGLADMHIHLPAAQQLDTFLLLNVMAGVTHLRAMNSTLEPLDVKKKITERNLVTPKVYYPYLYYSDSVYSLTQLDSIVSVVKKEGYDLIKVFRVPNETVFLNLMAAAQKHNMIVAGHYPKAVSMPVLLANQYRSIEHLGGYSSATTDSALLSLLQLTVKNQVFNCPTLDWFQIVLDQVSPEALPLRIGLENAPASYITKWQKEVAAYIQKNGLEKIGATKKTKEADYKKKLVLLKRLNDIGALLLVGSDPEAYYQLPGYSMYEEMVAFSQAGIKSYDIIKAATYNAALFFGEEKDWGTIAVGKHANVILLTKNPLTDIKNINSVEMTILDGKVYTKKALERLVQ